MPSITAVRCTRAQEPKARMCRLTRSFGRVAGNDIRAAQRRKSRARVADAMFHRCLRTRRAYPRRARGATLRSACHAPSASPSSGVRARNPGPTSRPDRWAGAATHSRSCPGCPCMREPAPRSLPQAARTARRTEVVGDCWHATVVHRAVPRHRSLESPTAEGRRRLRFPCKAAVGSTPAPSARAHGLDQPEARRAREPEA
jgi:hypothetical protein